MKIETQLAEVNEKWRELQDSTNTKVDNFERKHEVQRFIRDIDETKDWITEKDEALSIEDLGKDLRTVQALQRKHEGLERDLAALGDKVNQMNDGANKLRGAHPDSGVTIQEGIIEDFCFIISSSNG